jgi:hypothetical protein
MAVAGSASDDGLDMAGGEEMPPELVDSYIQQWFMKRFADGRDGRIIIDAENSGTGLGKTTAACSLCLMYDLWGWTADKASLDPREYTVRYDQWRPGSWTMLDEAEQAVDRRRSMSKETLAVGHDFATKRYRQVFGTMTLPSKSMMDARIADKLCDLWIHVEERGKASVYKFDQNAFTGKVYYKKVEEFHWSPLDDHPEFQALEQKKVERITGETQSRFVTREEFEDAKKNFWNKASAKKSYDLINAMYRAAQDEDSPVSLRQSDIGEIAGMSQSNISKIVNTDAFEEFYSSFDGGATA